MLMMVWVIYVVYNGQFTRMDQLFKLLKWLQTLHTYGSMKILEGMSFAAFLHTCETFI